ncbi:MAG: CinA family protein [Clostridia bacterium]|nr:CinA family protein [Clostridia bacterium]
MTPYVERVVTLLKEKNYHISFAESCTAGLAAGALVEVASASSVLNVSFVTYANEAKIKYAHVSPETLERFGAVSKETVAEMAKGCAKEANSEVGVGISGIAGPTGGVEGKPVGTVCFGISINGNVTTQTRHFGAIGRDKVRAAAVKTAFRLLAEALQTAEGSLSNAEC